MKAGIDYSMTSPAITVGPSKHFDQCKTFFYTPKLKLQGKHGDNIYGILALDYESQMERFHNLAEWALSICRKFHVDEVCLEDYSFGSTKGQSFSIGENGGILKYKLWLEGIAVYTPKPTQVKKHFHGKGNAKKDMMYEAFTLKTDCNIIDFIQSKPESNPISDIVDSYAMLDYGFDHYFK